MGEMRTGTCFYLHGENENWLCGTGNHKNKSTIEMEMKDHIFELRRKI